MATEKQSWLQFPLVTALMIFDRVQQLKAAKTSVDCFFDQNWPNKHLIIFNTTNCPLLPRNRFKKRRPGLEILLKAMTTQKMISLCFHNSNGEWCLNWMPDCYYATNYIETHLAHRDKKTIVIFKNKQLRSLISNQTKIINDPNIFPCWSFYRYFPVDFESSKSLFSQFIFQSYVDNPANLVTKFVDEVA